MVLLNGVQSTCTLHTCRIYLHMYAKVRLSVCARMCVYVRARTCVCQCMCDVCANA